MPAIERGILQKKTFSIEWKVERFFASCQKNGDCYKSPVFPTEYDDKIVKWFLKVYPKGKDDENKDCVSLYLRFLGHEMSEVTVDLRVKILSELNNLYQQYKAKTFKGPSDNRGWKTFVRQDIIKDPKNGVLVDDTLTIVCEITFHPLAKNVTNKFKDYDDLLHRIGKGLEDYEKLLEDHSLSDVTFDINDKKMYLHKNILMCRNLVFKEMFETTESQEKRQRMIVDVVEINDFDYDVMKEVFRFIYAGKVENIEKIAEQLFIAADKYSVTDLKALCEKVLYDDITVDNAIDYLKLTEKYETVQLKALTIDFVATRYKDIVGKSEFEALPSSIMCEIFRALAGKK